MWRVFRRGSEVGGGGDKRGREEEEEEDEKDEEEVKERTRAGLLRVTLLLVEAHIDAHIDAHKRCILN